MSTLIDALVLGLLFAFYAAGAVAIGVSVVALYAHLYERITGRALL